jgi:simple sugar transport system ATP-binding protein
VEDAADTTIRVDHLGFGIHSGEILGIAGVEGNGQSELVRVLSGMSPAISGSAELCGTKISAGRVSTNRKLRISHIPEDRMTIGMAGKLSVTENVIADKIQQKRFSGACGFLNMKAIRQYGEEMVHAYDILCKDPSVQVESLSGGNIQKVVLARELDNDPLFLIADQPTRGVDAGASIYIRDQLIALRNNGTAILLVSSDLQELLSLSDRILVMVKGKAVACFTDLSGVTDEVLGKYMLGLDRMDASLIRRNSLEDESD